MANLRRHVEALTQTQRLAAATPGSTPEPQDVLDAEQAYLAERRAQLGIGRKDGGNSAAIAISGGGVRSATFSLGVLQALARRDLLAPFDYISTVSGGGYIGSSLMWWLSGQAGNSPEAGGMTFGLSQGDFPYGVDPPHPRKGPKDQPAQRAVLRYLRQRGEYLTPGGGIGLTSGVAAVLRAMVLNLAVLLVFLMTAIVALEWASHYLLGRSPTVVGFYLRIANTLEGWIKTYTGETVFFPMEFLPYLILPAAALMFAAVSILVQLLYSAALAVGWIRNSTLRYTISRLVDRSAGRYVGLIAGALVLGTLPFAHLLVFEANGWLSSAISGAISAGGGALGLLAGLVAFLKRGQLDTSSKSTLAAISAGAALLLYALIWISYSLVRWTIPHPAAIGPAHQWLGGIALVALAFSLLVDIDYLTLHRFYRDRLMEAFLPDWNNVWNESSGAAKGADRTALATLQSGRAGFAPYHLINCNLVLVDSRDLTWRERGGDSFVLAPLHCGGNAVGWRSTESFMGGKLSLATAMATSGAAANPNALGSTRNAFVSLLMTILNLRLGIWVGNPRYAAVQHLWPNHLVPGLSQVLTTRGMGFHERAQFVQISDGGHFENLALYELIRRRARLIVLCDGAADPQYRFEDFQRMSRRIGSDFGAAIDIAAAQGLRTVCPDKEQPFGWPDGLCAAEAGFVTGDIRYADGSSGTLIYLKATLAEGLPPEVLGYAEAHPTFPNQTTADQFFDEDQFEAYRQLGYHLGARMIADADLKDKLAAL